MLSKCPFKPGDFCRQYGFSYQGVPMIVDRIAPETGGWRVEGRQLIKHWEAGLPEPPKSGHAAYPYIGKRPLEFTLSDYKMRRSWFPPLDCK